MPKEVTATLLDATDPKNIRVNTTYGELSISFHKVGTAYVTGDLTINNIPNKISGYLDYKDNYGKGHEWFISSNWLIRRSDKPFNDAPTDKGSSEGMKAIRAALRVAASVEGINLSIRTKNIETARQYAEGKISTLLAMAAEIKERYPAILDDDDPHNAMTEYIKSIKWRV